MVTKAKLAARHGNLVLMSLADSPQRGWGCLRACEGMDWWWPSTALRVVTGLTGLELANALYELEQEGKVSRAPSVDSRGWHFAITQRGLAVLAGGE